MFDLPLILKALKCRCPRCGIGALYQPGFTLTLNAQCPSCGLDLAKNDNGDGPAVFLIFVLGFTMVPLALITDYLFDPPLWVIGVIFTPLVLGLTLGMLRPVKAYVIALQFKHLPGPWTQD